MHKKNEDHEEHNEDYADRDEIAESMNENISEDNSEKSIESEVIIEPIDMNNLSQNESKSKKHTANKIKDMIKKKDEEIGDLKDQLLRRRAEFDNFRRRMETEKIEFVKYALDKSLMDLLPIIDSFDRAMHPDNESEETKHVYEGFSLIYKQLMDFLNKQGVTEINALGQVFDPNYHQAVSKELVEGTESGLVVKEYQKGYVFHKRVLRPSMVVVSE